MHLLARLTALGLCLALGGAACRWATSNSPGGAGDGRNAATAAPLARVPPDRLARLTRGANVRNWFTADRPSAEGFDQRDLDLAAALGLDHLRVPFRLGAMLDPTHPQRPRPAPLRAYEDAVARVTSRGLAVIVAVFATPAERMAIARDDTARERFVRFWGGLAGRLTEDPDRMFLEVLSQPIAAPDAWARVQQRVVPAIRAAAPTSTVIAVSPLGTNDYDAVDAFDRMPALPDGNVVYALHFYEPYELAYAGVPDRGDGTELLRDLPYPYDAARCEAVVVASAAGAAHRWASTYCVERWTAATIAARVGVVAAWAARRGVPVHLGEFGAWPGGVPAADRARWFTDVRTAFEAAGIGWSVWALDDKQGLGSVDHGPPDSRIVTALGLRS